MASRLGDRMAGTYEHLQDDQRLEPDTSLVKTYLVESLLPEESAADMAQHQAAQIFRARRMGRRVDLTAQEADDPALVIVEATVRVNQRAERVLAYVDIANPRFWLLHSMSGSSAVDYVVERLISDGPELDHAWLPADLLERVSTLGDFRGLSLDYDRRQVPDVDFSDPAAPVEFLKMQLWGNKAADVLRILRSEAAFPHETTLAKVKVKYWQDPESSDEFTLDDVKFDGKVTARGTSFASHIALLRDVYDRYAGSIRDLEQDYSLRLTQEPGARVEGEPICFVMDPPIADLEQFCDNVFSSAIPFRLWGVPVRIGIDYYRIDAVDLHVGGRMQLEVAPELIRMYLLAGSCGNSALRFYTNLQHHYNARVRTLNGHARPVFAF
jgi:hypothetical protein